MSAIEFIGKGKLLARVKEISQVPQGESLLFPHRRVARIQNVSGTVVDRIKAIIKEEKDQFQSLNNFGKAVVIGSTLVGGRVAFNAAGSLALGLHVGSAAGFLSNGLASRAKRLMNSSP